MADLISPALGPVFRALTPAIVRAARRLHAERKAGKAPVNAELMEVLLDQTLDRLRGGNIEDSWWRNLLSRFGQQYVAPDSLKSPALQEWLADDRVAEELKSLAKEIVMGRTHPDEEGRADGEKILSSVSGETGEIVIEAKDAVVAILVAGYIASIPPELQPLTAMVQELSSRVEAGFHGMQGDNLAKLEASAARQFPIVNPAITESATRELSNILPLRGFDAKKTRSRLQELLRRVDDDDLATAGNSIKHRIRHWTARLCAMNEETLPRAKELRALLAESDADLDFSIVDALIAEAEGDVDGALRLLRDCSDPDARSVCFSLVRRVKDNSAALEWLEQQDGSSDRNFLGPAGWLNWALAMAEFDKYEEASRHLANLEETWDDLPMLALVEGVINAALLLPPEFRKWALYGVPFVRGVGPNQGTSAERYHARATKCFDFVEGWLSHQEIDSPRWTREVADWGLWLRIMNPRTAIARAARKQVTDCMNDGSRAVEAISFAFAFDIPFEAQPLKDHLQQRNDLGGLDDRELQAEFFLSALTLPAGDLVGYLERNRARLEGVMPSEFLSDVHTKALMKSGHTLEEVQEVAGTYKSSLDEDRFRRLQISIDEYGDKDIGESLRAQYEKTDSAVDLRRLIAHLKMKGDWAALRPLTEKLFAHSRTVEHAMDVVASLDADADFDHDSIVEFLDRNNDLLAQSDDLQSAKAIALYRAGRVDESKQVNDAVLGRRFHPEDFRLDLSIALTSGNWERLGEIARRAWDLRDSLDSEMLMAMGQVSGQFDQIDQALKLANAAVDKSSNDPYILSAAYWLHFQLGREQAANPDWLVRATQMSSEEAGPVWRVSVQEFVTGMVPKRRNHLRATEQKWFRGEIPISVAAEVFNVSLTRLLLELPRQNSSESDGRRKPVLPIVAGARNPIELHEDWTIGLDLSSVLVLAFLGLLDRAIGSFHHVRLAPNVMELLFREHGEARFHQPSRIKAAQQVLELHGGGCILTVDRAAMVPESLVNEIGQERATLLHSAREKGGNVVCSLPIHKAGSLMEQEADISTFEDLIVSIADFCRLCYDRGIIGADDYQRAASLLERQRQKEGARLSPSLLDGPIYLDELSLGYLLDVNLLRPITAAGIQVRISPDVVNEMRALSEAGYSGKELAERIDEIRDVLRTAIETGNASLLPRAPDEYERLQGKQIRFDATVSLLAGASACDALCIDDRYINSRPVFTDVDGTTTPIVCVLEILRYLESQGSMTASDVRTARHKLRQGGFSFVLPTTEDLTYWLKEATFENQDLVENAELRTLRQSVASAVTLGVANWEEGFALVSALKSVGSEVISELWQDENISPEHAAKLSHWTWRNVVLTYVPPRHNRIQDAYGDLIQGLMSLRLGTLLFPIATRSEEKQAEYANWMEQDILQSLRPANWDIVANALLLAREVISNLDVDIDKAAFGGLLLDKLPRVARRLLIRQDAAFAQQCGFQMQRSFSIGRDVRIADCALFEAARKVFASHEDEIIEDLAGREVIVGLDGEQRQIVVNWSDAEDQAQSVDIGGLGLLSPDPQTRLATYRFMRKGLGPTAMNLRNLRKDLESRAPEDTALAELYDEAVNGVVAQQNNMIQKIDHGSSFGAADIIPSSLTYFERFCGPDPATKEPDRYFRDVLVPYRRNLLHRDLAAGLDICCLGALRDDLMPGPWVADLDNDAVWNALSSCELQGNPFSLLAGLDIALYRQDDERFGKFAKEAVARLTDENFGHDMGTNFFVLLQTMYSLAANRINLLEDGAKRPGYWKRIAAWMQAGLFVRTLAKLSVPETSEFFQSVQQWAQENLVVAGAYAVFLDARTEPMISASSMPHGLKNEVLGRLDILRRRHQAEERPMPMSRKLEQLLAKAEEHGRDPLWDFPGPLEGHRRPVQSIPEAFNQVLDAASREDDEAAPLKSLVLNSQLFSLGMPALERARQAVRAISPSGNDDSDVRALLERLELASVVAAASGDTALANDIADAAVRVSEVTHGDEVRSLLAILLQTAVVHQEHDAWYEWLAEKLTDITSRLPRESLNALLRYLAELETIMPARSWFHLRARATALAGML